MMIHTQKSTGRLGAVSVEFALTCPLLFLVVLGGIEFSRANMLMHTASLAATAAARTGIVAGATADDCRNMALAELRLIGITNARALVDPQKITDSTPSVTVGVAVPLTAGNGYFTPRFFLGDTLVRTATLTRQFDESPDDDQKAAKTQAAVAKKLLADAS